MGNLILIMIFAFIVITITLSIVHDMVKSQFLFCTATITGYSLLGIGFIAALVDKI